ncbi:MAG: alcohol dehydrogenase [Gammaproteobacteria bacterium HGW-Gammaproteobacteria-1]|jgi:alcohol dehydrogenase|nr:MAG: alcohol dehydrogenase [Gammaproteobacteria bacterium HGW-Gammaproteobacteria-1]
MNFAPFAITTLPRIVFGAGRIAELPQLIAEYGRRVLLVTGRHSLLNSPHGPALLQALMQAGISHESFIVAGEPSPEMVDAAVARYRAAGLDVVVGIGGGSVLDAAKAIAGLLPTGNSVLDHLEDVGRGLPYTGPALPLIAVPTTAGTGSEATKNAVLSRHGRDGFKKSFRHDCLVPRIALVDPQLLAACPPHLIAAQGLDAFTQLLESYVSLRANPFTDALAWSGLEAIAGGFWAAWEGGDTPAAAAGRSAMAYAALLSGITLAQVGLGSVHGLAQPLGSLFPVPHGVACGTMLAAATATNLQALRERAPESAALAKYARVGRLLGGGTALDDERAAQALVSTLAAWIEKLNLPRLGDFGISAEDIPAIVAASRNNSMKSNPVLLNDGEIAAMVRQRL